MRLNEALSAMINQPGMAIAPFVALLAGGMGWNGGFPLTTAFAYQGGLCTYRHRRGGTPQCGVTGPLYLLIALFSQLWRLPVFGSSSLTWSHWDHLFLVGNYGSVCSSVAQQPEGR